MKKNDWITWITIIVMIGCLLFFMFFYYLNQVKECSSNPLPFAANYYRERYPEAKVFGNLYVMTGGLPIVIGFNSTSSWTLP